MAFSERAFFHETAERAGDDEREPLCTGALVDAAASLDVAIRCLSACPPELGNPPDKTGLLRLAREPGEFVSKVLQKLASAAYGTASRGKLGSGPLDVLGATRDDASVCDRSIALVR